MASLFHATSPDSAAAIVDRGFRDQIGYYQTDALFCGVWLSDRPLDQNEGTWGDSLLVVSFPIPLSALAAYEAVEEGKPYREWCVPAKLINDIASVSPVASDDETAQQVWDAAESPAH